MPSRNKPISYTVLLIAGTLAALFSQKPAERWIGVFALLLAIGALTNWGMYDRKRRGG